MCREGARCGGCGLRQGQVAVAALAGMPSYHTRIQSGMLRVFTLSGG
jgi:hypothetical protein